MQRRELPRDGAATWPLAARATRDAGALSSRRSPNKAASLSREGADGSAWALRAKRDVSMFPRPIFAASSKAASARAVTETYADECFN